MKALFKAGCSGLLSACMAFSAFLPALAEPAPSTEGEGELVYSRIIDVPGVGEWQYYAQNDPLWAESLYEPYRSTNWRLFYRSGCGPTAAAIALSRQVDTEKLPALIAHKNPYSDAYLFCTCSVNGFRCDRTHELSTLLTASDFETYLPIACASYAAGNNVSRTKFRNDTGGTSLSLFRSLAEAYNLHYTGSRYWEDAYSALQQGYSVITTVSKGIFTTESHYLVIAHADEEWIYILDPYMRESYAEMDRRGILEVLEPGLVRAKTSDFNRLGFSGYYMLRSPTLYGDKDPSTASSSN